MRRLLQRFMARYKDNGLYYYCGLCGQFMPISHFPH